MMTIVCHDFRPPSCNFMGGGPDDCNISYQGGKNNQQEMYVAHYFNQLDGQDHEHDEKLEGGFHQNCRHDHYGRRDCSPSS